MHIVYCSPLKFTDFGLFTAMLCGLWHGGQISGECKDKDKGISMRSPLPISSAHKLSVQLFNKTLEQCARHLFRVHGDATAAVR